MTETAKSRKTTRATTAKTAAKTAPKAAAPAPEALDTDFNTVFSFAQAEMPTAFREVAERGVESAKENYAKLKTAAEDATDLLEDTLESTRQGVVDVNLKAIDVAKDTTEAYYAHAKNLIGVKSFAEVVELQSAFVREQFEAFAEQSKDMQDYAQKFAEDTVKPYQDAFAKVMKDARVA